MQHTTAQVVQPHTDQGHHGQDGCHQQPHANAHAGKHHCYDNQHRQHQAPGQVVQPVGYLVGLEEHLADFVGLEISTYPFQPLANTLAETDGVGGTFFHDHRKQHDPLAIKPGFRLARFRRAAPDFGGCRQGHLGTVRQFNRRGADSFDIGKLGIGKYRQPLAFHHNKAARDGLVTPGQGIQNAFGRYTKAVKRGVVQRQGNLFVGVALKVDTGDAGNIQQVLLQFLRHTGEFGDGRRTTHRKHHRRNINQPVIQGHQADIVREILPCPLHGLAHPVPGAVGVVDVITQFQAGQRHAGACCALAPVQLFHLAQFIGQRAQHQALNRLGAGARIAHGHHAGPVRKGRVFLPRHGAVSGDTQHTEHGYHHAQQALVIQQAAGHQRTSTVSPSTSRVIPA